MSRERDDWIDEAKAASVEATAERLGFAMKPAGHERVGPCVIHGGKRDKFSVNPIKNIWLCRGNEPGGDAIALVQHVQGCTFLEAVEWLTGRPAPGAEPETEEERRERLRRRAEEEEARRQGRARDEAVAAQFREDERKRLWRFWQDASPRLVGTQAETYLQRRSLPFETLPPLAPLRFAPAHDLYAPAETRGERPRLVHRGPALLVAVTNAAGCFAGLQAIWIDAGAEDGKLRLTDPKTGEILPARKTRGSAMGNRIDLTRNKAEPRVLYLGEGTETVCAVYRALARFEPTALADAGFWATTSIGNLAGRAERGDRVAHPTLRVVRTDGSDGGPRKVSGATPDLTSAAITVPDCVEELILLGDGDSEAFETGLALRRAAARHAPRSDGSLRLVRIAMAPPDTDFDSFRRLP